MFKRAWAVGALVACASLPAFADNLKMTVSDEFGVGDISLTATAAPSAGTYLVTSASGTLNGSAVSLLPPGGYRPVAGSGNDNLVFFPYNPALDQLPLDSNGISFLLADGTYVNLFGEEAFLFSVFGLSSTGFFDIAMADVSVTQTGPLPASPEPSSFLLLGLGLAGLAGTLRRPRFAFSPSTS